MHHSIKLNLSTFVIKVTDGTNLPYLVIRITSKYAIVGYLYHSCSLLVLD